MAQSPRRRVGPKLLAAALLIFAAAAAQYFYFNINADPSEKRRGMAGTGVEIAYDSDASAHFYSYDSRDFFFCTKDGMKYVSGGKGETKWEYVFNLSAPAITWQREYIAAGEAGSVYVFNPSGLQYEKKFENPV